MKWFCEECNHQFDVPAWTFSEDSENPYCPKCGSLNIDLNSTRESQQLRTEKQ